MNSKRLIKLQTAVVQIVIAGLMIAFGASNLSQAAGVPGANTPKAGITTTTTTSNPSQNNQPNYGARPKSDLELAQEACAASGNSADNWGCQELADRKDSRNQRKEQPCTDAIKEFNTNRNEFKKNCSGTVLSCMEKSKNCSGDVTERGIGQMAAMAFDSTGCANALTSTKCPELNAGSTKTAKDEKKDLEDKKQTSKDKLNDLMKESQELTAKSENSMQELRDKIDDSEKSMRDSQMKITDQIAAMKAAMGDEKTKAYRDARAAYTKIDEQYLEMRDQVRRDASAVAAAKDALQLECRAYAMKMYHEADRQLNERLANATNGVINEGSFTVAAGSKGRQEKKNEKQRNLNYAGYFNDCLSGKAPEGKKALNEIANLERQQKDNQSKMVDKAAMLEKQRAEVLQQIQELEASATEKMSSAEQQAQQQLQTLAQDYVKLQSRNQEKFQTAQTQLQREQMMLSQRMMTENQELQRLDSEIMLANTKVMCTQSSGGLMSESAGDRKIDKINSAMAALSGVQGACFDVNRTCKGVSSIDTKSIEAACNVYTDAETYDDYEGEVSSKASTKSSKGSSTSKGKK